MFFFPYLNINTKKQRKQSINRRENGGISGGGTERGDGTQPRIRLDLPPGGFLRPDGTPAAWVEPPPPEGAVSSLSRASGSSVLSAGKIGQERKKMVRSQLQDKLSQLHGLNTPAHEPSPKQAFYLD